MSDTPVSISPRQRLANKWQIPLFALSFCTLAAVATQVRTPARKINLDTYLDRLVRLTDQGANVTALDLAHMLLSRDDLPEPARGVIHLHQARALFGKAHQVGDTSRETALQVANAYDEAEARSVELDGNDYGRLAQCYEWLGQYRRARTSYAAAFEAAPTLLTYARREIELCEYPLAVSEAEIGQLLDRFIEHADGDPETLIWGLARRVDGLASAGRHDLVQELLGRYADRFAEGPEAKAFQYLRALQLWAGGDYDAAENTLRALMNETTVSDPLFVKAGWLLGTVLLNDGQPQRPAHALAVFREVIASRADPVYTAAALVGMGEALADLQRYPESVESYRAALESMAVQREHRLLNRDRIRVSLSAVSTRAVLHKHFPEGLCYLEMATALVDDDATDILDAYLTRTADLQVAIARDRIEEARNAAPDNDNTDRAALRREASELYRAAGENQVRVARVNTLNEDRAEAAVWTAAGVFEEGGHLDRAIEVLQRFVQERSDATLMPRVLVRLGSALQSERRFEEAIDAYQQGISRFPRSPLAVGALIPLAECFMMLGPEFDAEAESALMQILQDSDLFTPVAEEYRDAVFLLAGLYMRQERFEEAIPWLDEALTNYSDDPRIYQAELLSGNAYRLSALAIKSEMEDPALVGEIKRLKSELHIRLDEAARRYRSLIDRLETQSPSELDAVASVYLQDARLYEAASLFEQGKYELALERYERAAWTYKDSAAALGAYVQVINCYVFLGRDREAASSLRRAQYLVETLDDGAFDVADTAQSRSQWRQYFDWVAEILVTGDTSVATQEMP